MKTDKLLVTGASGFIGGHLLEKLVGGSNEIVALHHRQLASVVQQRFGDSVRWIKSDIAIDDLADAVRGVDTVFHLAAYSSIDESETERVKMERINIVGTNRLAAACKDAGVRHFIFVSSVAACEKSETSEIDESIYSYPISYYGKTKRANEESLLAMTGNGFNVTALRATALFGENHMGSIYELVKVINQGRFVIFGRGTNRINFYYIRDFIDVLIAVQNNDRTYGQVFIVADKPCQLNELVNEIVRISGCRHFIPRMPVSLGLLIAKGFDSISKLTGKTFLLSERRVRAMTLDTAYSSKKIECAIGIRPTYGLFKGL
ncbi:MAG: NAD-dependent epimerase/dehydratase family protein, partial [Proteobacteria bacterium]|nr:NAD-dependent epimerase/dehydratase family protein [Pseudomonadota bacterium]